MWKRERSRISREDMILITANLPLLQHKHTTIRNSSITIHPKQIRLKVLPIGMTRRPHMDILAPSMLLPTLQLRTGSQEQITSRCLMLGHHPSKRSTEMQEDISIILTMLTKTLEPTMTGEDREQKEDSGEEVAQQLSCLIVRELKRRILNTETKEQPIRRALETRKLRMLLKGSNTTP
jgi:hypothetical protein